jgi:hypothetical protein
MPSYFSQTKQVIIRTKSQIPILTLFDQLTLRRAVAKRTATAYSLSPKKNVIMWFNSCPKINVNMDWRCAFLDGTYQ